ncbi:MAG: tRNA (adenosine(37)-N6)-threonylcarbamoyltransferase complex ATPase subunit type 1 TsaE [Actinobacteria bacterium]|nr:tRNA (adenosine(37)-N6)-threonylcarbamoyltransferase complex ATPase subunit type 1 TsaE [Actinomycetota bacterium]
MFALGEKIGSHVKAGDLILLNGALGAGKTILVQGIGAALGIEGVTSPTFVIARTHKGRIPLIHMDAYRLLESGREKLFLDDLDLDTEREGAVTVIEWGGAESARLSEDRLEITIDRAQESREVTINPIGPRWAGIQI